MSSVLKISEAVALGIHACVIIAKAESRVSASEIAEMLKASEAHLAKVLQRLVRAGLILSNRGPKGGFTLAKASGDISLMEIYEAIDGEMPLRDCLFEKPACDGKNCSLYGLLNKVNSEVKNYFSKTSLSDLLKSG